MISIIVPIYNVEKYLNRCLESLVNQTYQDLEILLVNDGSTDNSASIANSYAEKYERVYLLEKVNGGLSDARNFGLNHAKGEYVAFIDSDDWVDLTMFEKMMLLAKEKNADIVCCDMEYVDDEGNREYSSGGSFDSIKVKDHPEIISINNSACNKIYRRKLFDQVQFPVGCWYEDLGTVPKLIFLSESIAKVNEPLYFYYQRTGSISHTKNEKVFDIYTCLENVKDFISYRTEDKRYLDEINRMFIIHGAELTTLRIKDYSSDREEFLIKNMDLLEKSYPKWIDDKIIKEYPIKKRIVFFLLKKRWIKILLKCFK